MCVRVTVHSRQSWGGCCSHDQLPSCRGQTHAHTNTRPCCGCAGMQKQRLGLLHSPWTHKRPLGPQTKPQGTPFDEVRAKNCGRTPQQLTWWWFCSRMPTLSAASVSAATCSADATPAKPGTGASTASVLLLLEGPLGLLLLLLDGPVLLFRGLVAALLPCLLLLALLLLLWSSGGRGGWDLYVWKIFCSGKHFLHQPSYSTHTHMEWSHHHQQLQLTALPALWCVRAHNSILPVYVLHRFKLQAHDRHLTLMSGSHQPLTPQLPALKTDACQAARHPLQGVQLRRKGLVRPRHQCHKGRHYPSPPKKCDCQSINPPPTPSIAP